ncbi:MAG: adenylate/guanylate cyclase domain-containing protein [Alphaproteobacteria bacterium]|mgnify:CR=1 FL=1|jgi:class 3 adenylate cyclase|nr:adenylate/guanylate cyclase domain-containing protein [Alphaproteobacteria bacterium]MDP6815203.1 adenylate/guanylate cyclase domain-containing protein [Alphaproteobacteria bacterium]
MFTNTFVRKLLSVVIGTACFIAVGLVAGKAIGAPLVNALFVAAYVGLSIGLFEVFFVQSNAGNGFRALNPLLHTGLYGLFILVIYVIGIVSVAWLVAPPEQAAAIYGRVPKSMPAVFAITVVTVLVLRVVSFLGARNLWYLLIGRYHRPVFEKRAFLFIDLKDSTHITEELGAKRSREFISRFLFDISKPITDRRGDIYKYMGDGLIATWNWDEAIARANVVEALRDAKAIIDQRGPAYQREFGHCPEFRAGIHGGEVIVSKRGDLRRAIEYNGDNINIAARMEQKAKDHELFVVVSEAIADELQAQEVPLARVGEETVKGISKPIGLYTLAEA